MNRRKPASELRASVQVGPGTLQIEARGHYPDGRPWLKYTITAPVIPYYGREPRPGAVYTHQRGLGPRTESELRRDFAAVLTEGGLYAWRGKLTDFPYTQGDRP